MAALSTTIAINICVIRMDVMSKNVERGATYTQICPPDRGAVPGGPPDFPGDEESAIYICPVRIVERPVKSHRTKGSVHEGEHRAGIKAASSEMLWIGIRFVVLTTMAKDPETRDSCLGYPEISIKSNTDRLRLQVDKMLANRPTNRK
jgi:hypothetical protein